MATTMTPGLANDELVELLGLIKGADSVELKLTVPDSDQRSAVIALGVDPLDAQVRLVYFFDTPELTLNEHGLVVRARRVQRKGEDSVVKLRPVVPAELPGKLRRSPNFNVEVDAMPGGYVCSASLKAAKPSLGVQAAASGETPLRKLFSKEQRAFFAAHAPEGIELDDLTTLGPIFVLKLKSFAPDLGRKLVTELWLYPDGTRILELSTKCEPGQAFQVAAEARAHLTERGVTLGGEQQTKTSTALRYFAQAAG